MKKLSIYAALFISAISCNKSERATENKLDKLDASKRNAKTELDDSGDILAFYEFMEAPVNGKFGLRCYQTFRNPVPPATASRIAEEKMDFVGAFYDADKNIIPGGTITFGKINFFTNPKNSYVYDMSAYAASPAAGPRDRISQYWAHGGQTQAITIDPNPGGAIAANTRSTEQATTSLYLPSSIALKPTQMYKEVLWNNNFFTLRTTNSSSYDIYWYPDPDNSKGVVIAVEYDYDFSSLFLPSSPSGTRKYYKAFRVPDNGHFTLSYSDIAGIFPNANPPFEALTTLTIGRANYSIAESPDGLAKYGVYATTVLETVLRVNVHKFGLN
ncbi:hypothetical protein ACTJJ0_06120 [Chitinophaga sp. 22321]|uniref:Uncharacterized protein n=1 Tax=Chitinophaga hostae TaxID=2831022 RepID=A0ABS5IZ77_9BACT|nr:hypothetical protein [Chitinophaga hostae]MBS0028165.1 hypothetical protein [Chitinophaga hostae]